MRISDFRVRKWVCKEFDFAKSGKLIKIVQKYKVSITLNCLYRLLKTRELLEISLTMNTIAAIGEKTSKRFVQVFRREDHPVTRVNVH